MKLIPKKSILALSLIAIAIYCQVLAKNTENTVKNVPTATQNESFSNIYY